MMDTHACYAYAIAAVHERMNEVNESIEQLTRRDLALISRTGRARSAVLQGLERQALPDLHEP